MTSCCQKGPPLEAHAEKAAARIVKRLRDAGHEAYFAGGCVRDMVRGVEPEDIDIATSARPEQVSALFPKTFEVGAQFGVVIVHAPEADFEVATFRVEGAYVDGRHPESVAFTGAAEDVRRRDFTINGMLYDPLADEVHDWVGGRQDIASRTVRTIGNPEDRFTEDKVRLLRAVRFAARLGYSIEAETYAAMERMAPAIVQVSVERIRDELLRILTADGTGRGLRLMHDTGLLAPILPEIEALVGVAQPPQFHPEGDVFEHTCLMLDAARNPSPELAMGILLHDVGKPPTRTFDVRIRFNEHDAVGTEMAKAICRRLRFSNEQIERIAALVANHMRICTAPRMRLGKLKRLLAMDHLDEHLELHRLDCLTSHGKLDVYDFIRARKAEFTEEQLRPAPLLNGRDLMAMGYRPGPIFGEILSALEEEQLEGRLTDRASAEAWVRSRFPMGEGEVQDGGTE